MYGLLGLIVGLVVAGVLVFGNFPSEDATGKLKGKLGEDTRLMKDLEASKQTMAEKSGKVASSSDDNMMTDPGSPGGEYDESSQAYTNCMNNCRSDRDTCRGSGYANLSPEGQAAVDAGGCMDEFNECSDGCDGFLDE